MATVSWKNDSGKETKIHIENGGETLCGREIPVRGKEWSVFGTATCQRCLKAQEKLNQE
ncbi:hypothetical protein REH81_01345 [Vibrio rotiferianus]